MSRDEIINQCLDLDTVREHMTVPVTELRWRHYVDSRNDPALWVQLVLDESVQVEPYGHLGRGLSRISVIFYDRLLKAGLDLLPFVTVVKQSELDEALAT